MVIASKQLSQCLLISFILLVGSESDFSFPAMPAIKISVPYYCLISHVCLPSIMCIPKFVTLEKHLYKTLFK